MYIIVYPEYPHSSLPCRLRMAEPCRRFDKITVAFSCTMVYNMLLINISWLSEVCYRLVRVLGDPIFPKKSQSKNALRL